MAARLIESALCSLLLAGAANAASSPKSFGIKLQDSSTDASIAHMRIILDHSELKPGRITLQAENQSKTQVHEVHVARDDGAKELPFAPSTIV